jgi:hypothetical protein
LVRTARGDRGGSGAAQGHRQRQDCQPRPCARRQRWALADQGTAARSHSTLPTLARTGSLQSLHASGQTLELRSLAARKG